MMDIHVPEVYTSKWRQAWGLDKTSHRQLYQLCVM